jgi:hypothetical protein
MQLGRWQKMADSSWKDLNNKEDDIPPPDNSIIDVHFERDVALAEEYVKTQDISRLLKTQNDWIAHWNNQQKAGVNLFLPSIADYYRIFSKLREDIALGTKSERDVAYTLREVLLNDFKHNVMTSTKIQFSEGTLEANIIHNAESNLERVYEGIVVPEYEPVRALSDMGDKDLPFLQALFETKDDLQWIQYVIATGLGISGLGDMLIKTPIGKAREDPFFRELSYALGSFEGSPILKTMNPTDTKVPCRGVSYALNNPPPPVSNSFSWSTVKLPDGWDKDTTHLDEDSPDKSQIRAIGDLIEKHYHESDGISHHLLPNLLLSQVGVIMTDMIQYDWAVWWNRQNSKGETKRFASMGDLYNDFKELYLYSKNEDTNVRREAQQVREEWRRHFYPGNVVTSTRITYGSGEKATVVHHLMTDREKRTEIDLPFYEGINLLDILKDEKGVKYIQTLYDTEDDIPTICEVMTYMFGKSAKNIVVNTPDAYRRHSFKFTPSSFLNRDDEFRINYEEVFGESFGIVTDS